jgi:hypothetical protein
MRSELHRNSVQIIDNTRTCPYDDRDSAGPGIGSTPFGCARESAALTCAAARLGGSPC